MPPSIRQCHTILDASRLICNQNKNKAEHVFVCHFSRSFNVNSIVFSVFCPHSFFYFVYIFLKRCYLLWRKLQFYPERFLSFACCHFSCLIWYALEKCEEKNEDRKVPLKSITRIRRKWHRAQEIERKEKSATNKKLKHTENDGKVLLFARLETIKSKSCANDVYFFFFFRLLSLSPTLSFSHSPTSCFFFFGRRCDLAVFRFKQLILFPKEKQPAHMHAY